MNLHHLVVVQGSHWIPDYTLRASTDTTYLKVRKNTYLVAVKASRMENSANYPAWREEELDEVLVKITENDADFCSTRSSMQRSTFTTHHYSVFSSSKALIYILPGCEWWLPVAR